MLRLTVLFCIAAVALGSSCDFTGFRTCMKAGGQRNKTKGERKERIKPSEGDRPKNPVFKCLEAAKCQLPAPRPKETSTGSKGDKATFEKIRECRKNVTNSVKNDIQACVQKQFPDFNFPEHEKGKEGHHGGKHHRHGGKGGFQKLVNSSCPTDQAKSSALACIKALPHRENNRSAKICAKKTACLQSLTPDCQQQLLQIKQARCTCAKSIVTTQSSKIEANFKACKPQASAGGPTKHKNHGFNATRVIQRFCQNRDPCAKPNFQ